MKKKILLLSTFIIVALVMLCTGNKKEVKAEEDNCQTYYNYYLFLENNDRAEGSELSNAIETKGYLERNTGKWFALGVPAGAKNISHAQVTLDIKDSQPNGNVTCEKTTWNVKQFYDVFTGPYLRSGDVVYSNKLKPEEATGGIDENCSYARATPWEDGDEEKYTSASSVGYDDFKKGLPLDLGAPKITVDVLPEKGINEKSHFNIYRKYTKEAIDNVVTYKKVLSPAVYYVKYDICEEETPTYTLTVKHLLDDETNKKLKDNFVDTKKYKTGEDYEYNCPAIDGYTVVNSTNKPSTVDGTFEDKDITRQCYYTEEEKTYTLTINYGDSDADCSKLIGTSKTYEGLKEGENKKHEVPKEISSLVNPKLGNISTEKATVTLSGTDLSVTMPDKNVSVCIVYTGQYGVSWIYLVWVIGGLALGYSIWYFVRYYKKQNSEI